MKNEIRKHLDFKRWSKNKSIRVRRVRKYPVGLLLLGSLRYIGRGWTFDDLEEATGISQEVHRKFFHTFITFGNKVLYPRHIIYPKTAARGKMHMH